MALAMMLGQDWQLSLLALIPLPFVSVAVYHLGKSSTRNSKNGRRSIPS